MMKKNKFIVLLLISIFIASCSKEETTSVAYETEIANTISTEIISPKIRDLVKKTAVLKTSLTNFSTKTNEENLKIAQQKLTEITKLYAQLYTFNIGEVKNNFINRQLNFWPVYNISIEKNIKNDSFKIENIENLGSATKNLPGLNYLLFKFENPADIIAEYQKNPNRIKFLLGVFDQFNQLVQQLNDIWFSSKNASKNTFENQFRNNTDKGLDSSFNQLFNGLYNVIDNCKVTKVGKPAGLESSSHVHPEIVENYYTGNSLDLIYENILSVEELFFSKKITSIADYIKSVTKNDTLNNTISAKIQEIKSILKNDIKQPLKEAVTTDKKNVKRLHTALKELLILLHNDVRSSLSIIITGTDNDGD
ncbi:imelysin family protein [Tenacibaculum piscium]|uniref:imelysin family protein n=1 Tax=Tenacibaculum piscium TaxID=1458515 RepID=UPI00187B38D1|nr:imelysin family protein [Tenacibaculum piscium]